MSYKSRQKKREYRQAERSATSSQKSSRGKHPDRYYLSIVRRDSRCAACGGHLRVGTDFIYRHLGNVCLCTVCAQLQGIAPFMSYAVDQRERKRRRRRKPKAIASLGSSTPKAA
jgi:hypothetical protein